MNTLCGIPIEQSLDAPTDRIVLHPEVMAQIEMAMMLRGMAVNVAVKQPQP